MSISIETRLEQLKYLLAVAQADDNLSMQEVLAINEFMKQFPELDKQINFSERVNVSEINFNAIIDEIVFDETIKMMDTVAKSDGLYDASKSKIIDDLKERYDTYKLVQGFDSFMKNYSEYELKQIAKCYDTGFTVDVNEQISKAILAITGADDKVLKPIKTNRTKKAIETKETAVEAVREKKSYSDKLSALRDKVNNSNYVN